jgi:TPR repeat protein
MNPLEIETLLRQGLSGDAAAQLELGYLYAFGIDVQKDHYEAVRWYQSATAHDSVISMYAHYALGKHYSQGHGVEKNNEKAMHHFRLAAEKGLSEAQFSLAECYYLGNGTSRNPSQAAKWYRLAAEQGRIEPMKDDTGGALSLRQIS